MLSGFDLKRVDRVKRVALETKLEGVIDEDWKRLVTRESIRQIIINAMEMVYQPKRTEEELDLQERIVQVNSNATSSCPRESYDGPLPRECDYDNLVFPGCQSLLRIEDPVVTQV